MAFISSPRCSARKASMSDYSIFQFTLECETVASDSNVRLQSRQAFVRAPDFQWHSSDESLRYSFEFASNLGKQFPTCSNILNLLKLFKL